MDYSKKIKKRSSDTNTTESIRGSQQQKKYLTISAGLARMFHNITNFLSKVDYSTEDAILLVQGGIFGYTGISECIRFSFVVLGREL